MNANFPDSQTMHDALSLATRAPSIHNSQPWRWRVGANSVHLHADPSLRLEHADPDGRELMISCGAALNHLTVALAALGWQSKVRRFPDPARSDHLASMELHRYPPSEVDIALAAAIPRRRTDRRNYSFWPVSASDVALMGARAARLGVTLRRMDPADDFRALMVRLVSLHASDHDYLLELATWSGRYGSTAGVPARNTPRSDPRATVPARIFAGPALAQPPDAEPADDNGVLLALGTDGDEPLDRLRAGEATSLMLLTATALGLASCPVSEPLEISSLRDALQTEAFGIEKFPQMLVRMGWSSVNADPLPATPRRPLPEVVTWLNGSTFN
jgi:nitroreductase